ncbi:MAG: phosphoribosylanthranilate isomerase [Acidobacteriota bacterium]|nr:phosphoribosylanthranilate isomerase [Acidobacteriota bacterium]
MSELPVTHSFVKICGVTSPHDAELVVESGADALGVILTTSRRRVDATAAGEILEAVAARLFTVGVVDSEDPASIGAVLAGLPVDAVQVHGGLSLSLASDLRARGLAIIKVLSVGTADLASFDDRAVDAVLVDGAVPGSGVEHSFRELGERTFERPVIAAGGLTPHRVGAVIGAYGVWGVDVATGVESAPGVKDAQRVLEFGDAARRAFANRGVG